VPAQIGEKHRVQVVSQFRLALKSASRADCPYLYCSIVAAGGKLAAVVVPCDRRDQERVRAQWRPDFCLYLCIPLRVSHILMVLSSLPLATMVPSGFTKQLGHSPSVLSTSSEQNRCMHRTPPPHSPLHVSASIRLVSNRLQTLLPGPDVCFDRDASLAKLSHGKCNTDLCRQ
jgi:hypothetical protein